MEEETTQQRSGFLSGKTAIVTGAARGLGAAFVTALADEGARVIACDIDSGIAKLPTRDGRVTALPADVSEPDDVQRVVETACRNGRIDVLINNAGVFRPTHPRDSWEHALRDFEQIVGTNLKGAFLFGRAVAARMTADGGGGEIVNISTDHVLPPAGRPTGGGAQMDLYDASKWALRGLTEAWSLALRKKHIRVNELCMGATDTAMLRSLFPGEPPEEDLATWMKPEQIAAVLIELLREGPEGRTGEQIGLWVGDEPRLPKRS